MATATKNLIKLYGDAIFNAVRICACVLMSEKDIKKMENVSYKEKPASWTIRVQRRVVLLKPD